MHDMAMVEELLMRTIVMDDGHIVAEGKTRIFKKIKSS
jgi:energy-coupling factor transporter ATP-binding protein EcfA2